MTALALAALLIGAARAGGGAFPGPEVMAAFEGNVRSGYAFASVTSPSFNGRATLVARLTTSHLYYSFEAAGVPAQTEVQSPGLGLGVGVRWRPKRFSLTALAGYEARYTMEFAPDSAMESRTDHGVCVSADAYLQADSRLAFGLSGYYGFAQRYVWARALAKRKILPLEGSAVTELALGVDATLHGNELVRGADGGLLAEVSFPGVEVSVGARVGLGREVQAGADDALVASLGVSIYKSF